MKISRANLLSYDRDKRVYFTSVQLAVIDALTPNSYSYEGNLERIEEYIKLQNEIIAKLIDKLYSSTLSNDELTDLLGYKYEIEE